MSVGGGMGDEQASHPTARGKHWRPTETGIVQLRKATESMQRQRVKRLKEKGTADSRMGNYCSAQKVLGSFVASFASKRFERMVRGCILVAVAVGVAAGIVVDIVGERVEVVGMIRMTRGKRQAFGQDRQRWMRRVSVFGVRRLDWASRV